MKFKIAKLEGIKSSLILLNNKLISNINFLKDDHIKNLKTIRQLNNTNLKLKRRIEKLELNKELTLDIDNDDHLKELKSINSIQNFDEIDDQMGHTRNLRNNIRNNFGSNTKNSVSGPANTIRSLNSDDELDINDINDMNINDINDNDNDNDNDIDINDIDNDMDIDDDDIDNDKMIHDFYNGTDDNNKAVPGDNERDNNTVTYRPYGSEDKVTVDIKEFIDKINEEVINKK